jgi:hypothetical protein
MRQVRICIYGGTDLLRGDCAPSSSQRHRDTEPHREESLLGDSCGKVSSVFIWIPLHLRCTWVYLRSITRRIDKLKFVGDFAIT